MEFATSDIHVNHKNIMKYSRRPGLNPQEQVWLDAGEKFKVSDDSVNRMNDYLLEGINSTVGEKDTLYFLGDFLFASKNKYYEEVGKFREQIKCKNVVLIFGNHDEKCEVCKRIDNRELIPHVRCITEFFQGSHDLLEVSHCGLKFVFSHYALLTWNKMHRGIINCYGHSHSSLEEWADKIMPGRRAIDVGVDNAVKLLGKYRPFSIPEVISILEPSKGFSTDHHAIAE